jgi:hypothetical protein
VTVGPAHHVGWRAILTSYLDDLALTRRIADLPAIDHQMVALVGVHV